MAAPNIFYLTDLPWCFCHDMGSPRERMRMWDYEVYDGGMPFVIISFYEGEDLMSDSGIFFCSKRLREALYPLEGAFFVAVHVVGGEDEVEAGTWLPVTFYEIAVEHYIGGLNLRARAGLGLLAEKRRKREWESWRPRANEWNGQDIFMMNDQFKRCHGPLVTESFLKRIQGFNVGDEFKAEQVQWG